MQLPDTLTSLLLLHCFKHRSGFFDNKKNIIIYKNWPFGQIIVINGGETYIYKPRKLFMDDKIYQEEILKHEDIIGFIKSQQKYNE